MENCLLMARQLMLDQISKGRNKNFVMSPMSIVVALSILAFGSRGRTLEQLLDFLEAKDMDDLKAKASLMMSAAAPAENTKGLILSSLNGVWIDQRFAIRPSFKEIAETVFKAEANAVDFLNEAEIVRNKVNLWVKNATKGLIKEVLPPGAFSYGFEAKEIMKNLGLTLPFETVADFTEIIESLESGKVFVSSIVQESCIEVNEKGTKAAAATCVSVQLASRPPPRPSFVANHPFMFMIREEISGIIFFVGVVLNPLLG
ncbi:serpin-z1a [Quercus suber]|uniref:Serpin-z1a n=1 Tax=Quercus suber TaxID=58331 RepID=A0AAW0IUF9_QUESU